MLQNFNGVREVKGAGLSGGLPLVSHQKAKARNACIAPYRIDYSKDNGAGRDVFESRDFDNKETNSCV